MKLLSLPIGTYMAAMVNPKRFLIESIACVEFDPILSSLLMKIIRGTL